MDVSWVEGWTQARRFRLSIDGTYVDLTGRTFVLVLRDNAGTVIASPGTVAVVSPQSGATLGAVDWTPASATILTAAQSPMTAHFEETSSGLKRYWPNEQQGLPMTWFVGRHGG
jgi:hypothetical protein